VCIYNIDHETNHKLIVIKSQEERQVMRHGSANNDLFFLKGESVQMFVMGQDIALQQSLFRGGFYSATTFGIFETSDFLAVDCGW
jgi:hypothetical protein